MEEIVVVVGIKKNYIKYMEVMLTSLLINNKNYKINFNILQDDFSNEIKENINKKFEKYINLEINYLYIKSTVFSDFPTLGHLVIATYYRILASEILTQYDKVLYLDVDIIVDGNISELWNTNIEEYVVAAVREESVEANEERLGIPKNQKYFNAGVLLMNLKKIREEKFFEKIMNYLKKNYETILYSDQDVLNAVFYNNWLELDEKWNYHNYFVIRRNSKIELINLDTPRIIHYTGPIKPWELEATTVLKEKYLEYEQIYLSGKDTKTEKINFSKEKSKIKISLKNKLFNKLKSYFWIKKVYNLLNKNKFFREKYHKVRVESIYSLPFNSILVLKFKKYIVLFSKNREQKYFFELGTVDRDVCNQIYFDGLDYSSSGFFSFIRKDDLSKGEYELGILIRSSENKTHFKKLYRKVII